MSYRDLNIDVIRDLNIVVGCGKGETNMHVILFLTLQPRFVTAHVLGVASPDSLWSIISHTQLCKAPGNVGIRGQAESVQTHCCSLTNTPYCPA